MAGEVALLVGALVLVLLAIFAPGWWALALAVPAGVAIVVALVMQSKRHRHDL